MHIDRIDHIVLTVRDISHAFYSRVLGMDVTTSGAGRKGLVLGGHKINLHQAGREFEPKAHAPTRGSAAFCLVSAIPLPRAIAHLRPRRRDHRRTGAQNRRVRCIRSVPFRDPDFNLVEISTYEPRRPADPR